MGATAIVTVRLLPVKVYVVEVLRRDEVPIGRPILSKSRVVADVPVVWESATPLDSVTLKVAPVAGSVTASSTALHGERPSAVRHVIA
jgi:hypothetical protein